ncbi:MAG: hypothetical protein LUI05_06175 [Oscillospiraceae bacterium]|nr:hypothetical protein [Oscillospiraceae bacterium]
MAGKFELRTFSEIDLNDKFFDELKNDYPGTAESTGFVEWFNKKSADGKTALVFNDDEGLGAFVCIKTENEIIKLKDKELPSIPRIKISTLRIAERYRGQRLGEGSIGLVLWKWQKSMCEEIYVTVFEKHTDLITQLDKFGFVPVGKNNNNECVYMRSRSNIDYSNPYKAFPFINPNFEKSGYLIIDDNFHDILFPYSELKYSNSIKSVLDVSNGISKIYLGSPSSTYHYNQGEPIFIYRKFTGEIGKRYKSCLTTYCVVKKITYINKYGKHLLSYNDYLKLVGNKSVYTTTQLEDLYKRNVLVAVELVYYGYFGQGNNVNMDWLSNNGCWGSGYPTETRLSTEQFKLILRKGNIDVHSVIVD